MLILVNHEDGTITEYDNDQLLPHVRNTINQRQIQVRIPLPHIKIE